MINEISIELYEKIKYFIPRLLLPELSWGDIVVALGNMPVNHHFWENWFKGWYFQATTYETKAMNAIQANHVVTARENLIRAAVCYHWSEFMLFDDKSLKMQARQKVTDCFEKAMPLLGMKINKLHIPFSDLRLPGYFIAPDDQGVYPCVILINGLDSAKEIELFAFAKQFLSRNISVFIFDGPGQGLLMGSHPLPIEFEPVIEACINSIKSLKQVDFTKLGLFGVSFGGYLALRAASAFQKDIKACINLSGGFDVVNFDAISSRIQRDFAFVFQQQNVEQMAKFAKTHLTLKDLPSPNCPILCIHGGYDTIFTLESCQKILAWAGNQSILKFYPNENHVCQNYFHEYVPFMCDWMAEKLISSKL